MRLWQFNDIQDSITFDAITRCVDENEILAMYWDYWSERMKRRHRLNWAWEVSQIGVQRNS